MRIIPVILLLGALPLMAQNIAVTTPVTFNRQIAPIILGVNGRENTLFSVEDGANCRI
jgi:hypothetical protein